jgi:non-homologous end joining protein Ku
MPPTWYWHPVLWASGDPVANPYSTKGENVSFHLLHKKCGSRVRNQHYCPVCTLVVEREDLVRGFQHPKHQHVPVTEEELEALRPKPTGLSIWKEFIPLASVTGAAHEGHDCRDQEEKECVVNA